MTRLTDEQIDEAMLTDGEIDQLESLLDDMFPGRKMRAGWRVIFSQAKLANRLALASPAEGMPAKPMRWLSHQTCGDEVPVVPASDYDALRAAYATLNAENGRLKESRDGWIDLYNAQRKDLEGVWEQNGRLIDEVCVSARDKLAAESALSDLRARAEGVEKTCNMQDGPPIPWKLAEAIWQGYALCGGSDQPLQRVHDRGGFGWDEVAHIWKRPKAREAIIAALTRGDGK